jgi:uncharacterized OB-fold protein
MISPVKVWRNQKYVARMLGKTGSIISWTVIRVPPANFGFQAPYAVAIVKLQDGTSLCAQVVDCAFSDLAIGSQVRTIVRKTILSEADGVIPYGIKVTLL